MYSLQADEWLVGLTAGSFHLSSGRAYVKRLVDSLSRRTRFDPRNIHMGFVVEKNWH